MTILAPEGVQPTPHLTPTNELTFQKVQSGLDYWRDECRGRQFPARSDIDPSKIKALLPNIMLLRVLNDGADYEFRIVGQRTIEEHGFNPLNWRIRQLDAVVQGYADFLFRLFECIRTTGRPLALRGTLRHVERGHRSYESVYLPLGSATVDHILNVTDYSPRVSS